ncbi:MarR family winged helix-turn-helix transcriptional regulator [Actinomadura sp. NPDC048032]|uniref:MarR family winged helix-turn-helix transcriptional regulator n=1 Tax=Actinomadura sp. NPDC048032 TaxID=3155747 RepID=UPI00340C0C25
MNDDAHPQKLQEALEIDMYRQPGHLFRRAQQIHAQLWAAEVSTEVTSTQFAVLSAIAEAGQIDQNSICRRVSLDTSTVAEVANRLTSRGHVIRTRDTRDRRRNLLSLSPDGERIFAELSPAAARMTDHLVGPLSLGERAELVRLLHLIIEAGEGLAEPRDLRQGSQS